MFRSLLLFFLLAAFSVQAQKGNYFLSHYTPNEELAGSVTFSIAQDNKGIFYFANNNGVLEFDGRNWGISPTPGPIFTVSSNGAQIFAGGYHGFGKIILGPDNVRIYQSLTQGVPNSDQIISSLALNDKIYFCNHQTLFEYSVTSGKIERTIQSAGKQNEWSDLFGVGNSVYIKASDGVFKIENGKVLPSDLSLPGGEIVEFTASLESRSALFTSGNRLFIKNDGLKEVVLKDQSAIQQYAVTGIEWVTESLIAIGTLRNGIYFVDASTGETMENTNFFTGLPDNEVYAMLGDGKQGLWVAHAYGFTRVAPLLPFRSFSHYTGLNGNLLCATTFQGVTYIGTTLGLYALTTNEIERTITKTTDTEGKQITKSKSSGLFSFMRKKRLSQKEGNASAKETIGKRASIKVMGYTYRKVEGMDSKVTQLMEYKGQLLASGNFGIASITNFKSKPLYSSPVHSIFVSPALDQILASTIDDEVKTFTFNTDLKETHLLDTLNEYISYIFEDKLQNIWLCGRTHITKVETVDGSITSVEEIPFVNPTFEESVGLAYGNEVYVAAAGSFNRFNIQKNIFEKYDSFPGPKKYFASAGYFWFNDGHRWRTVDPRMQNALKLEWLSLFPNLRYLAPADKGDALWIITASNELYKFSPKNTDGSKLGYPLFLKEIRGQQNKFTPARSIRISQLESTVAFEFIQPDYLGMKAVEYRYQVRGLNNNWTAWSTDNNIVNFSYLPTGSYKLEIQTRDLMGKVSQVEQIDLVVEPPYWKRWWFYLLEMVFFATLVFLSIKLSDGKTKYRLISQVLSLLTVIMLIQLIQTIVASYITFKASPVIDFFVQVGIALLVLPLENAIEKFIRKGKPIPLS